MAYQRTSGVTFPSRALGTEGGRENHDGSCPHAAGQDAQDSPGVTPIPPVFPGFFFNRQVTNPAPVFPPRCGWCGTPLPLTHGSTGICSYCSLRELLREAVTGLLVVASVPGMWVVGAAVEAMR